MRLRDLMSHRQRMTNDALMWLCDHSPSDFISLDEKQYTMPEREFELAVTDAMLMTEAEYELIRTELAEAGLM